MEGIVLNKNEQTKSICIGKNVEEPGIWYKALSIWNFCENLNKNDNVEFNAKDDNLTFIRSKQPIFEPVGTLEDFKTPNEVSEKPKETKISKDEQIVRMSSLKAAVEYAKIMSEESKWTPDAILLIAKKFRKWIEGSE